MGWFGLGPMQEKDVNDPLGKGENVDEVRLARKIALDPMVNERRNMGCHDRLGESVSFNPIWVSFVCTDERR